jgi:hypothetical protein
MEPHASIVVPERFRSSTFQSPSVSPFAARLERVTPLVVEIFSALARLIFMHFRAAAARD